MAWVDNSEKDVKIRKSLENLSPDEKHLEFKSK